MRMRKKPLSIMVALLFAFTLVLSACGGNGSGSGGNSTNDGSAGDTPAATDDGKVYTMRIGTGSGGADPQPFYLRAYADKLEELSEGRIDVQVYESGQLGNMAQLIQGVQDGSIECVSFPTTYFATVVPEINMLDVPYLWNDPGEAAGLLNANTTSLDAALDAKGVTMVSYIRNAGRMLISSKDLTKVHTIDDLKKLALKTFTQPSELLQDEAVALGGSPANLDIGEVTPSLQNGTIDAAMVGAGIYAPFGMYEVAPYMLLAPRDPMISCQIINNKYLESLPADLQDLVFKAAEEVFSVSYEYSAKYEQDCIDEMTAGGLKIIETTPELEAGIQEALTQCGEDFLKKYPEMQGLYDELKAIQN
ncbi:MAG: TRAP transporter substrate-binding protein [Clostridiales Family XIII bacterium]|nr:TRAP transporter substrate-binding protein [Clostridiales Family XIII bacterium]